MSPNARPGFRFSLRTFLLILTAAGAAAGVLGRLFFRDPELFLVVLMVLSTIVPYLAAIGTILWIGFRSRRKSLMVWAALLLATPFLGIASQMALRHYAGPSPGGLGFLSTRQVIHERLPQQIDEPWVWRELERRLQAGSLSQTDADAAVSKLIAHLTARRLKSGDEPLHWQQGFLQSAIRAGKISESVQFDLCDAFFGPHPAIQPLPRLREDAPALEIEIVYGSNWSGQSGLGVELAWEVERVLLDGKPLAVKQSHRHGSHWSGRHEGNLNAGDHELAVEVECAYIDQGKLLGRSAPDMPKRLWPPARKRWHQSLSVPLKVYARAAPLVSLVKDPQRQPRSNGGISVERLIVQAGPNDSKTIALKLGQPSDVAIPLSYDVAVTFDNRSVPLGCVWLSRDEKGQISSGSSGLEGKVDGIDPALRQAELVLTPNPQHIEHRPEATEIWGEKIVLPGIPLERWDLDNE